MNVNKNGICLACNAVTAPEIQSLFRFISRIYGFTKGGGEEALQGVLKRVPAQPDSDPTKTTGSVSPNLALKNHKCLRFFTLFKALFKHAQGDFHFGIQQLLR